MTSVLFGQITPQHLPVCFELDFPYAVGVLSRQADGQVYAWLGGSSEADTHQVFKWMSVTKFLVSVAFWCQSLPKCRRGDALVRLVERDARFSPTLALDTRVPAGLLPEVSAELRDSYAKLCLADLLSHCSGLPFDDPEASDESRLGQRFGLTLSRQFPVEPFVKRIYSNYGFELGVKLAESYLGVSWQQWVEMTVLHPLGMSGTKLFGSPAWGAAGTIFDLSRLAAELLSPTLFSGSDLELFTAPQHGGIPGILPGYGYQKDNLWAAGVELHGTKSRHYLPADFPAQVFSHFGQSGSFIWVDYRSGIAGVFLGAQPFGEIHQRVWQKLNAEIKQLAIVGKG